MCHKTENAHYALHSEESHTNVAHSGEKSKAEEKKHSGEKFYKCSTKLISSLVFHLHSSPHLPLWNDAGARAEERRKAKKSTKMLPSFA